MGGIDELAAIPAMGWRLFLLDEHKMVKKSNGLGVKKFRQRGNKGEAVAYSQVRVRNERDLIRVCEIDTEEWSIEMCIRDSRLSELLPLLDGDGGGHIGSYRSTTQAFIDGLLLAHSKKERVEFH